MVPDVVRVAAGTGARLDRLAALHMLAPLVEMHFVEPRQALLPGIRLNESLLDATHVDRLRARITITPPRTRLTRLIPLRRPRSRGWTNDGGGCWAVPRELFYAPGHDRSRSLGLLCAAWVEHFTIHGPGDAQGEPTQLDDEFAGS